MAYEMVMPYHLHMPSYFLETFTEYPFLYMGILEEWGSFLLYGVDEVLLHITRMNALSFWKER